MEVVQVQCGRPRKQTTAQNAAMITRRAHTAAGFSGGRLVGGAEAVASFNPATSIVSCRDATISCRESRDGREDVSKSVVHSEIRGSGQRRIGTAPEGRSRLCKRLPVSVLA